MHFTLDGMDLYIHPCMVHVLYIYIKLTYILNILSFRPCAGLTDELGDDEEGSAWAEHVLNAACHMHAIV